MKKGFTLVEVLVSTLLATLIFYYLYGAIDNIKVYNQPYEKKLSSISKESNIFDLFFKDFSQHTTPLIVTVGKKHDMVTFNTKNSLHNIQTLKIYYFISKNEKTLIRVETLEGIDLYEDLVDKIYFSEIVATNVTDFKIKKDGEFVNIMLLSPDINPIILRIFSGA